MLNLDGGGHITHGAGVGGELKGLNGGLSIFQRNDEPCARFFFGRAEVMMDSSVGVGGEDAARHAHFAHLKDHAGRGMPLASYTLPMTRTTSQFDSVWFLTMV